MYKKFPPSMTPQKALPEINSKLFAFHPELISSLFPFIATQNHNFSFQFGTPVCSPFTRLLHLTATINHCFGFRGVESDASSSGLVLLLLFQNHYIEQIVPVYRAATEQELTLCPGEWKYGSFFTTVLAECRLFQPWATKR